MQAIEIVPIAEIATRFNQLRATRQPALFRGLLASPDLASWADFSAFVEHFANEVMGVSSSYVSGFPDNVANYYRGRPFKRKTRMRATLREYLDVNAAHPEKKLICNETLLPQTVLDAIDHSVFKVFGFSRIVRDYRVPVDGQVEGEAYGFLYLGTQGKCSELHTDWDARDVLIHQIAGRKRVTIIPSAASGKVQPLFLLSSVNLRGMSAGERARFLEYTGGQEIVLEPGDTLYLPPMVWHEVTYIDDGASMNLRFGGIKCKQLARLMAVIHIDAYSQNLIDELMKASEAKHDQAQRIVQHLLSQYERPFRHSRHKCQTMREETLKMLSVLRGEQEAQLRYSWLSNADMCVDVLAKAYELPDASLSARKKMAWGLNEKIRNAIRALAFRLANSV